MTLIPLVVSQRADKALKKVAQSQGDIKKNRTGLAGYRILKVD